MAIHQRKQTNVLLTFKVLQFVNQLRQRVKPRTPDGSVRFCQLGTDALGLRAIKNGYSCVSSGGPLRASSVRNTKSLLHHGPRRVCKRRKGNVEPLGSWPKPRAPALHVSAASDTCAEGVQQYV
jgi:hypothetical protein